MKSFFLSAAFLLLLTSFSQAQTQQKLTNDGPCRVMEIHCQCENPHRDFIIPNQKVGKFNTTEQGVCQASANITNLLKSNPTLYCIRAKDYKNDTTKYETKCSATWSCKEPCNLK